MNKKEQKSLVNIPSIQELIRVGAHFGHERSRVFPGAKKYVFTIKNRILVINLEETQKKLKEALAAVTEMAANGKTFLFIGTKSQAIEAVARNAKAVDMPYVNYRWLGGTLTNFDTILKSIKKLESLEELANSPVFEEYTKKERGTITKKIDRLNRLIGGIKNLKKLPDALIIVDIAGEKVAAKEAQTMGIPVFGLIDTNADPTLAKYPIPANDDSRKAIELMMNLLAQAIKAGKDHPAKIQLVNPIESEGEGQSITEQSTIKKARVNKKIK